MSVKRWAWMTVALLLWVSALPEAEGRRGGGAIKQGIVNKVMTRKADKAEAGYPTYTEITGSDTSKLVGGWTYQRKLQAGARGRFYEIYLPQGYQSSRTYPLVLDLHGGSGNPTAQAKSSSMNAASDKQGFIAVYPAGTGPYSEHFNLTWNIYVSNTYATSQKIDDASYFGALFDDVTKLFRIDGKRIFSTGISQGGMTSYHLACHPELSKRLAAIGPVAAAMILPPAQCRPAHPISVIHFHGTEDHLMEYGGGKGKEALNDADISRPSVADTLSFWLKHDRLPANPTATSKRGKAELKVYAGGGGVEVRLWTLIGGGHTWPGSSGKASAKTGAVNKDISATDEMVRFFLQHPYIP